MVAPALADLAQLLPAPPICDLSWAQLLEGALILLGVEEGLYAVTTTGGVLLYVGRSTQLRQRVAAFVGGLVTGADDLHVVAPRARAAGVRPQDLRLVIYSGQEAWGRAPWCVQELRPPFNHDGSPRGRRGHWSAAAPDLPLQHLADPVPSNSKALIDSVTRKVRST